MGVFKMKIILCILFAVNAMTHYQQLGLSDDAPLEDVKKAFRRLSLVYHPDKNEGNTKIYENLIISYETILKERREPKINLYHSNQQYLLWVAENLLLCVAICTTLYSLYRIITTYSQKQEADTVEQ